MSGTTPAAPTPELIIRGGTVVDRSGSRRADVRIVDGEVVEVADALEATVGATVLDAGGCIVAPGLVDLHTHLREPGREEAETVESGTRAAALGGYTAVVAMPNTDPPLDSAESVRNVFALAEGAMAEVAVAGAITVDRAGERLAPMAELAALGVRLFTDDGDGVAVRRTDAPGPRSTPPGSASASSSASTARTGAWPPAAPCTKGPGRAGSGCRACRPRPRR